MNTPNNLSENNIDLEQSELDEIRVRFDLNPNAPLIAQISRFDRLKDPVGVIEACKLARQYIPRLQLVLAGGCASDDPEGEEVLNEAQFTTYADPKIKVFNLLPDTHRTINPLQRLANIVLQKSTKEGFDLTVIEALWKGKHVIGGDTGGIYLQVVDFNSGLLVNTPEGAALRIYYFFNQRLKMQDMVLKLQQFMRDNFLLTLQLREYITRMLGLHHGYESHIELR